MKLSAKEKQIADVLNDPPNGILILPFDLLPVHGDHSCLELLIHSLQARSRQCTRNNVGGDFFSIRY